MKTPLTEYMAEQHAKYGHNLKLYIRHKFHIKRFEDLPLELHPLALEYLKEFISQVERLTI